MHDAAGAIHLVAGVSIGFVFLGLLMGSWLWVRVLLNPWGMACAVMVIKSCDIGAYFTGRFLGKHKLIVWLSPGKTWEGLVGGMAVSGLVAVGLSPWLVGWPWWYAALGGAALGYAGQVGDLFASALKRDAGAKDFAETIPGFGGVMDVTLPRSTWARPGREPDDCLDPVVLLRATPVPPRWVPGWLDLMGT